MMGGASVEFLPVISIAARSQRDVELARSRVTAHAARVCHARRKSAEVVTRASVMPRSTPLTLDLTSGGSESTGEDMLGIGTKSVELGAVGLNDTEEEDVTKENAGLDKDMTIYKSQHLISTTTTRKRRRTPSVLSQSVHALQRSGTRKESNGAFDARLRQSVYDFTTSASLSTHKLNDYVMVSDKLSDRYTAKLLHYSVTTFWPGFDPGPGSSHLHTPPFIRSWAHLSLEEPALFHTAIWAAALHNSVQTHRVIDEHGAIEHHHLALQNISQQVAKPIESISEATILAVLGVSTRELNLSDKPQQLAEGFHAPFRDLQWLHVYGRRPYISCHETVWIHLVEMKGGLNSISIPSFAALMQYTDVIGATLRLRRPRFPVCDLFQQIQTDQTRHNCYGHKESQSSAANDVSSAESTSSIDLLTKHGLSNQVLQVMLDLRVWTNLLKKYGDHCIEQPDFSQLAIHRNLLQHRLLCTIPPDEDIEHESTTECAIMFNNCGAHLPDITKIVRICLLLFSIGVTFPITYHRPFRVLVDRLQAQVLAEFDSLHSAGLNNFLIWVCMLGGIVAAQLSDEVLKCQFVDILARVECAAAAERAAALEEPHAANDFHSEGTAGRGKLVAQTWEQVKLSCLQSFVWHDEACDFGARLIWEEVKWRVGRSE